MVFKASLALIRLANAAYADLIRLANAASLALIRLANAAGGLEMRPVNDAMHLPTVRQDARRQLPYGSGKTKGELVLRTQAERKAATAIQLGET